MILKRSVERLKEHFWEYGWRTKIRVAIYVAIYGWTPVKQHGLIRTRTQD